MTVKPAMQKHARLVGFLLDCHGDSLSNEALNFLETVEREYLRPGRTITPKQAAWVLNIAVDVLTAERGPKGSHWRSNLRASDEAPRPKPVPYGMQEQKPPAPLYAKPATSGSDIISRVDVLRSKTWQGGTA